MAEHYLAEAVELRDLTEKVIARYPSHIGYIKLDGIEFYWDERTNQSAKAPVISITGLGSSAFRKLLTERQEEVRYVVVASRVKWEDIDLVMQPWLMMDLLYCIDADQEGKLRKRDCIEHAWMVEKYGPYWRDSSAALIDDMFATPHPPALPPPPPNHDVPTADLPDDE